MKTFAWKLAAIAVGTAGWMGMALPSHAVITPKDSSLFGAQYNMNNAAEGVDPAASTAHWTRNGGFTSLVLTNGTLAFTTTEAQGLYYESQPAIWSSISDHTVGYTIEVRVRVDTEDDSSGDRVFTLVAGDGGVVGSSTVNLIVGLNSLKLGTSTPDGSFVNNDAFHIYRIAHDPADASGEYRVWRDGVALTWGGGTDDTFPSSFQQDLVYFVDGTSGYGGSGAVDYVRFDLTGAFSPVPIPEPTTLVLFGAVGLFVWRRARK